MIALMETRVISITPHRTPIANKVKKEVDIVDQMKMMVTRADTTRIAGTGVWVLSFTSDNFLGRTLSKDQAKSDLTGIKVLPIIAGRFQNRKETAMRIFSSGFLMITPANRVKYGFTGRVY